MRIGINVSRLAGQLAGLLVLAGYIWGNTRCFPYSMCLLAPLLGGGFVYIAMQHSIHGLWVIQIGLGLLTYAFVIALMRALTRSEVVYID